MTIDNSQERAFMREAINGAWNVQTLKRQHHSSLYERLALSRNNLDMQAK